MPKGFKTFPQHCKRMAVEIDANENSNKCRRDENIDRVPFYKLFSFADSIDILLMVVGTVGAVANGAIMPFTTALFGEIINAFGRLNANVVDAVSKVALKYAFLAVGSSIVAFLQVSCWIVTGERQASRIRALYLKAILRQDIAFFDMETNTGEVIGKMSGDSILIQDAIGEKVGKFVQLTSTFAGGFAVAFAKCWILTFVMIASIPMFLLVGAALTIIIDRMASRERVAYAKASTVVEQTISSIKTVASFTGEKQAIANYRKFLGSAYNVGVQEGLAIGLGVGSFMLVAFCCFSLAIWFGARMILEKGYSGGSVINVMIAVFLGAVSLGQATSCLSAFAAGQAAAYKMFETINRKPKIDAYETKGMVVKDIHGDVELRRVYFSYPARPDEKILQGFSLFIPNGTTAALVGQSGCGKSTVISLIERFYDPQAGKVLIDGVDIRKYRLKCIREKIALVSQEPALFTSSILDNIAYGKEGATIEEIRTAAKLANAAKFIDKLPEGLDTMVGERGMQISGGQKQRIAIARAILKDPRILLLDEATSALDSKAERKVQDALDRIMVNRTTVMVAHRLSTVRNADMIAVIHHGKIVEKGTHPELLKDPNGAYSRLIQLQNMHKECNEVEDKHKRSDMSSESFKYSGQSMSPLYSIGWGSFSISPLSVSLISPNRLNENALEEHKPIEEGAPEVSISRLANLNKPETVVLISGTIAASMIGTIFPVFGLLLSKVIKTFFRPPKELREDSEFWALIFLIVGLVSLVMYPLQKYLFAIAGSELIQRIRSICFERVVHMEIGWFDEPQCSSAKIGAKLSADAAAVRSLVGDALAQMVQNIASSVVGLIIAFTASWQLAFIILAVIPLLGISNYAQARFLKGFSADSKMMYEQASQVAKDAVSSIRTVASFCAEKKVMDLYKNKCEGLMRRGTRQGMISGIGFGVSFFLLFSVYATSFYAGAQLVQHKKTTFTGVFQVFFALSMAAMGVTQSSSIAPDFSKAKRATASIFAIIDRKSTMDSSNKSGTKLNMVVGKIALSRVSFKYPSRPNVQIFRNLSLVIPSGKTVALVGESGSGKSTIISLLLRFYDPDSGRITLDGVNIRELRLKWLRKQMGLVSQEPTLFNDTIRANIEYGKGGGNVDEAEIIAASKLANAHKFISSLQQGYDTLVGDGGVQLSGGQKQRVAIARAIIKNPKILLLDEATSALDAESEKVVQDALNRVMVNHTAVIVAHRLSTIKNADVIAVVKDGVIVEKGTHESLINIHNGFYASLVSLYTSTSDA